MFLMRTKSAQQNEPTCAILELKIINEDPVVNDRTLSVIIFSQKLQTNSLCKAILDIDVILIMPACSIIYYLGHSPFVHHIR